ncbi:alpha(1,3)fucosyltransferase,putative [Schistosoma mansoni]|uniref:Transcription initiation factor TFIID subunit 12 n=1 Tax=Schistosoma mansoni TaxID=6183 RepID=G4LWN5_SCHMA|nr:alpha(1,3)fucosyltransferase,putative [Schistosoma mansoni]|eukprot:XP_018645675.1 alpha(1,3)fucosyltransferase,putative [Schistosoma mansoni]
MKGHSSSTLPPGSVLIQSGQAISQTSGMAALQTNSVTSGPQNLQVWTPSPSGAITVSGIPSSRSSANLVTLPSGQTVLMANLVTTATTASISLPTSSVAKQQIQVPTGLPPGGPIVISNPNSAGPLATQLTNPTVIQGPNGQMSVALPGGIISSNTLNSFNSSSTAFVSSTLGNISTDQPVHIAQIVDNHLRPGTACFTTNAGFQGITPMNQVLLDSTGFNLGNAQTQNKLINMSSIRPPGLVSSPMQPVHPGNSFVAAGNIPRGLSVNLSSDITNSQSKPSVSQPVIVSTSNLPVQEAAIYPVQDECSSAMQNSTSTSGPVTTSVVDVSSTNNPSVSTAGVTVVEIPCSPENGQTNLDSKCITDEQTNSVFTSSSLTELLTEFEPHLQLDPDVEEVITNLANEFIVNCAEKAQQLALHRGISNVEAKDVVFCMERDWNVIVPGFATEERLVRKNFTAEAHKQRLALIKKQIKKM